MPDDPEAALLDPDQNGTVRLVKSALNAPPPPAQAEAESRRQVEQLMQEAALSPKKLQEAVREQPRRRWWQKFLTKG